MVEIWVDPVHGNDGLGSPDPSCGGGGIGHEVVRINNPGAPTKTIQVAIDIAAKYLRCHYDPLENPDQEAIVHLMPGIYGPATNFNGQVGNDEEFPIVLHDRVHLRGVNARRCVIRGVSTVDSEYSANLKTVFWPENVLCGVGMIYQKQVLIDCSFSSLYRRDGGTFVVLPWADDPDYDETSETIDSVSFQGGVIQVLYGFLRELPLPLLGKVSNCLFDMRDGTFVEIGEGQGYSLTGPSIGLLIEQTWTDDVMPLSSDVQVTGSGYLLQEVASIGNTFLMAEFVKTATSGFWARSRPGAVGILDTCDPICPTANSVQQPRGVNRLGVQNTLFRTFSNGAPADGAEMAMVGVSFDDARVLDGVIFRDTNAYAHHRSGSMSAAPGDPHQSFDSPPYEPGNPGLSEISYVFTNKAWKLYPCDVPSTPPQSAAVKIWDGNASAPGPQVDPAFVGEYLRTVSPVKSGYRDWRLLPGSPMQNLGFSGPLSVFEGGAEFEESECEPLQVLKWDHEQYGNLRVVDGGPDIGFDEVQLGVMAGSYANHSYSHNRKGVLNPFVPDEQETRFLFLRRTEPGASNPLQGRTLTLRSNEIVAGSTFRGWTNPPGSLTTPTTINGPPGYRTLYTDVSSPVVWMGSYTATVPAPLQPWPNWQGAPGQPPIDLTLVQFPVDDEGTAFASWVNVQPVVTAAGVPPLIGSMQPEFR